LGVLAALAPLLATGTHAQEQPLTGAQVLERCTATDLSTLNWCMGFILGVGGVASDSTIDAKYRVCLPPGATSDVGREAVVAQIKANAALQDVSAAHAVWYALTKTFACPKG
jgi:hypothetical protein